MGYKLSAYHFYGVHVPNGLYEGLASREADRLDRVIYDAGLSDTRYEIGHLLAGPCDADELFLCISIPNLNSQIELGEIRYSLPDRTVPGVWGAALRLVAGQAGYRKLAAPAWITVLDYS